MRFFVAGTPAAQPRPRARVIEGGPRRKAQARIYNPAGPCREWRAAIAAVARQHAPDEPFTGPLAVSMEFVFPRPQARVWKTKPMPAEWRPGKPDLDNLAKAVKDALTGSIWRDDAQVVELVLRKRLACGDRCEPPGVHVSVEDAGEVGRE